MYRISSAIVRFFRREDGPTAVEYAVMLALIISVVSVGVASVGSSSGKSFSASSGSLEGGIAIGQSVPGGTAASTGIFSSTTYNKGDTEHYNAATNEWVYTNSHGTFHDSNSNPGYLPGGASTTWTRIE